MEIIISRILKVSQTENRAQDTSLLNAPVVLACNTTMLLDYSPSP
jgi:hypothetical protein